VPSLTGAENHVISRADVRFVIDWRAETRALEAFLERMPFRVRLDVLVASLAGGEKQKLEILKLLYLDQRLLILDEPTSVLTPSEADEILEGMAVRKQITVIMITHKFREVTAFADAVTVLRRGRKVGAGNVADVSTDQMARLMIGDTQVRERPGRAERPHAETVLELAALYADDDDGLPALQGAAPRLAARYSEFARFFRSRRVDG
jgi:general nucleoside transport system ATP-binding protein